MKTTLVVATLGLGFLALSPQAAEAAPNDACAITIAVTGDSIAKMTAEYLIPISGCQVINVARAGSIATDQGMLEGVDQALTEHPDYLVIGFIGQGGTLEANRAVVYSMMEHARRAGATVVFAESINAHWYCDVSPDDPKLRALNAAIESWHAWAQHDARAQAPVASLFVDWDEPAVPLAGDCVHPTPEGRAMLAQRTWSVIQQNTLNRALLNQFFAPFIR